MAQANVTWGAPRIRNELAMLGIEVAVSTVAKYLAATPETAVVSAQGAEVLEDLGGDHHVGAGVEEDGGE